MNEARMLIAFDEDARLKVRQALRGYMRAHAIGAPTLQTRIIEADAPRHREIPLKTLQRFIAGSHRTTDAYVELCASFLKGQGVAIEGEAQGPPGDEIAQFGAALERYLPLPADQEPEDGLWESLGGDYQPVEPGFPAISLTIAPADSAGSVKITEAHIYKMPDIGTRYEGVLVRRSGHLFGLLRDQLTCEPRVYWLWRGLQLNEQEGAFELSGQVSERPFKSARVDGPLANDQVRLRQVKDGANE